MSEKLIQKGSLIKLIILLFLMATIANFSHINVKENRETDFQLLMKSDNLINSFNEKKPRAPPSDWTIIHYIDGDNNLDSSYEPSATGSDANVDIIALDDGRYDGDTHAYHVFSGANVEIPLSNINPSWTDEVNMGDPNTLINFSRYCVDNYPSDAYLIIPQDHGGAWKGCCRDDTSLEDSLNISDLKTAFSNIASYIGHNIDIVLFNDCLMSSIEIAVQLYPYVDYMVGGETVIWVNTWDNCDAIIDILKATPSITPQELAIEMINQPTLHDSVYYSAEMISAINSSKIFDLQNDINDLATELINKFIKYQIEIENARLASKEFIGPRDDVYEMLIDLYDFAENIYNEVPDATIQNYALNVMNTIGPDGGGNRCAILKERKTSSASFCHGLSLYFPPNENLYNTFYSVGNDFTTNTNWDEFLQTYWDITSNSHPNAPYNPFPSDGAIEITDNSITLSVNVSDDDDESMDVYFYNATDDSIIESDISVSNGTRASVVWSGLTNGKTYEWYTKVDDTKINITSSIWTFTIPNKTKIDETDGQYNFTIAPIPDDFDVNISIAVLTDTELFFTGVEKNPTNTTLNNELLFIYLTLNESSNLDGWINFTIKYNSTLFKTVKIWWFNESADNNRGEWQEITFVDLGDGLIKFSVNHTSVFALTEVKITESNTNPINMVESKTSEKPGKAESNIIFYIIIATITITSLLGLVGISYTLNKIKKKRFS